MLGIEIPRTSMRSGSLARWEAEHAKNTCTTNRLVGAFHFSGDIRREFAHFTWLITQFVCATTRSVELEQDDQKSLSNWCSSRWIPFGGGIQFALCNDRPEVLVHKTPPCICYQLNSGLKKKTGGKERFTWSEWIIPDPDGPLISQTRDRTDWTPAFQVSHKEIKCETKLPSSVMVWWWSRAYPTERRVEECERHVSYPFWGRKADILPHKPPPALLCASCERRVLSSE